jgi:hypothetical protein
MPLLDATETAITCFQGLLMQTHWAPYTCCTAIMLMREIRSPNRKGSPMLDRLQRCMKNRYENQRNGRLAWEFIKRGERPPNSLWKDSIDPDPEFVPILFPVGVFFALVMASLGYVSFSAILNNFAPLGVNIQTIAAGVMFSLTLAFVVYASVIALHPTRRRRAAKIRRIRWMHRRFSSRASGEPATRFERWVVAHASYDFGAVLRVVGFTLKWWFALSIPILLVIVVVMVIAGRNAVPSWLIAPLYILFPRNLIASQFGMFIWFVAIMMTIHLGRKFNRLGRIITQNGRGKLLPDLT